MERSGVIVLHLLLSTISESNLQVSETQSLDQADRLGLLGDSSRILLVPWQRAANTWHTYVLWRLHLAA